MVSPKFSAEKKERRRVGVVGFIQGVVAATMSCLFGCFRSKDSHSRLASSPDHSVSYNDNTLSSLFLSGDDSVGREELNPLTDEFEVNDLASEATFLKACGTLLETPVEIRKGSWKRVDTSAETEAISSSFKSWLPNSSSEKQPDESPAHIKTCQEWVAGADLLLDAPGSCWTDENSTGRHPAKSIQSDNIQNATLTDACDNESRSSISSVLHEELPSSVQGKYKSVRFECESNNSTLSPGSSNKSSNVSGSAGGNHSSLKSSPYPTPLKISDEMQTPGTVFPAYMDNTGGGKPGRIRSQYVYMLLNRQSHREESKDENCDPNNRTQPREPNPEMLLTSTPTLGMSNRKDEGSRAIAAGDLILQNPSKCWNGNGIPNTTNKYKEDRKVNWHATPFEERLEKALSEESRMPQRQRKHDGGIPLADLNEAEESDAGFSSSSSNVCSSAHQNKKHLASF